jgi:hypothetical protein
MKRNQQYRNKAVARNRIFIEGVNSITVCAHCGAQPIEWHNWEHVGLNRKHYQIGSLVGQGAALETIKKELLRCTPLCRSCHMKEDGRLQALRENRPFKLGDVQPPKVCEDCGALVRIRTRGRCLTCYARLRRSEGKAK